MNNTDKSELEQAIDTLFQVGLDMGKTMRILEADGWYGVRPELPNAISDKDKMDYAAKPYKDKLQHLITQQCSQARIAGELEELEMAADFAKDVLQQFGYNGKSGGLSTLEWAEGIVKRFEKANTQAKETETK